MLVFYNRGGLSCCIGLLVFYIRDYCHCQVEDGLSCVNAVDYLEPKNIMWE